MLIQPMLHYNATLHIPCRVIMFLSNFFFTLKDSKSLDVKWCASRLETNPQIVGIPPYSISSFLVPHILLCSDQRLEILNCLIISIPMCKPIKTLSLLPRTLVRKSSCFCFHNDSTNKTNTCTTN